MTAAQKSNEVVQKKIRDNHQIALKSAQTKRLKYGDNQPGGRPLKFNSPEQVQELIDKYFLECKTEQKPPTVTGLALALGTYRDVLIRYENKNDEYYNVIKTAKEKCQSFAEEQLYCGKNAAGTIFALKNNWKWRDEQTVTIENANEYLKMVIVDLKELLDQELTEEMKRRIYPKFGEIIERYNREHGQV